jgi:hypothetical protein
MINTTTIAAVLNTAYLRKAKPVAERSDVKVVKPLPSPNLSGHQRLAG